VPRHLSPQRHVSSLPLPSMRPAPLGSNPDPNLLSNTQPHSGLHKQPCKKPGDVHMPCPYPHPYQDTLSRPRRGRRSSYPGHPEHPTHHGSQATRGLGASAHPHTCSPSEGGSGTGMDTKLPTLKLGNWLGENQTNEKPDLKDHITNFQIPPRGAKRII